MDKFQKPHAYSRKPAVKEYTLYDSIYRKCPEKAPLHRHKVDYTLWGMGWRLSVTGHNRFLWVMEVI